MQRHVHAIAVQQTNSNRDVERQFFRLSRRWCAGLHERECQGLCVGVIHGPRLYVRRAGLAVPALELFQVASACICHRGAEIVARHCLPVVTVEIEIHALAEAALAQQSLVHANDFSAFFVNRDGVKIVDFDE